MTGKILLLFFVFFSSSASWAMTPFLEPYVGISKIEGTQESTFTFTSGTVSEGKNQRVANGFHLGARIGVLLGKSYTVFGEYFQGGPYEEASITAPNTFFADEKLTNRMIGAGAGIHFDVISLSATFFFKNTYDFEIAEDATEKAARVGLSLPVSKKQFIRANLDLFLHLISDSEQTTTTGTGTNETKLSITTAAVSLSFPFDF